MNKVLGLAWARERAKSLLKQKVVGIALFLVVLYVAVLLGHPGARTGDNHFNLGRRIGLYGIISLGVGILILSGGIDLSIGSVAALSASVVVLLNKQGWPPLACFLAALGVGLLIGLFHGLIVTKLRVQAFVVTLCGLFLYRGLARWLANDANQTLGPAFQGFWRKLLYSSDKVLGLPMSLVILLGVAAVAAVFLHFSVHGRYLTAIGSNEKAARYSGIPTDRYKIAAYMICSGCAALYGILFLMEANQVQPSSTGNFDELYAIAGAVLGGCSLRGGEGTVPGILIGTAILRLLSNFVNMWDIPSALEFTVIGAALLLGAILDEALRRRGSRKHL
jgi:ribose transport system permease protein